MSILSLMDSDPKEKQTQEKTSPEVRRQRFIRETVGIVLGIGAAMMFSSLVPAIREQYSLSIVILWGAAIGGLLASYERFERAGEILTRSENRALNILAGVGIPVAVLAILYWALLR